MFILPDKAEDFANKSYWEEFFSKRDQPFDWYGTYEQLKPYHSRYIRPDRRILVLGCGNSTLSQRLFEDGYEHVISIDRAKPVVDHMNQITKSTRYICMDAEKMSFNDEDFDVVYDKATMDTICSGLKEDSAISVLTEIDRILKPLGVYILVTLAQKTVLAALEKTLQNKCYILKTFLVKETSDESRYPVFMMVWMKLDKTKDYSKAYDVWLEEGKPALHFRTFKEHIEHLQQLQSSFHYCANIRKRYYPGSEFKLALRREQSPDITLLFYVVDGEKEASQNPYGAFIVPVGREVEWMYRTPEGRRYFADSICYKRLVIVVCGLDENPEDLNTLKEKIAPHIHLFKPDSIPPEYQIPLMSLGEDVGERVIREQANSTMFGAVVVEDVRIEDEWYRRLILKACPSTIQSEVALKNKTEVNKKRLILSYETPALFVLTAFYMRAGPTVNCLIVGLGGGTLVSSLSRACPNLEIVVEEIDSLMVELARKWFGLPDIEKSGGKVIIRDGISHILEMSRAGDHRKFDLIMMDVNTNESEDNDFLTGQVLEAVRNLLKEEGIFVSNFLTRIKDVKEKVNLSLNSVFAQVEGIKDEENVNELFVCRPIQNDLLVRDMLVEPDLRQLMAHNFPDKIDKIFEYLDNLVFNKYSPL